MQTNFTVTTAAQTIDQLVYTYASGKGNQLTKVEDSGTDEGFKNGFTASDEMQYNDNGSMTADKNKGIDNIIYNFLGKPSRIEFSNGKAIEYKYDAAGNKLTTENYDGTTLSFSKSKEMLESSLKIYFWTPTPSMDVCSKLGENPYCSLPAGTLP